MPKIGDVVLKMNRPQYVSVPEGFISALAWNTHAWDAEEKVGKKLGLVYIKRKEKTSSYFLVRETIPRGSEREKFGEALRKTGLGHEDVGDVLLSDAVTNSVTGIQAEKSTLQAASPVTAGFALLQNVRGVQGAANPPQLAAILETIYAYGRGPAISDDQRGVSSRWLEAVDTRCKIDPLLFAMDAAVKSNLLGDGLRRITAAPGTEQTSLAPTPFSWFTRSWDRLTSKEWVQALPARVWTDWATTLLRLAMGLGFLWEAAWNEMLARKILSNGELTWDQAMSAVPVILPWPSSRASTSVRDVASVVSWRVHKGGAIRKVMDEWFAKNEGDREQDFETGFKLMQSNGWLRDNLMAALGSQEKSSVNTWEAIKYALLTRDIAGPFADYYGLLRGNGRYLTVEPGTEWIAVVASLACEHPGGKSNVGALMSDLQEMGLDPEVADLVELLERAGLARGSADADQGVLIQSAY